MLEMSLLALAGGVSLALNRVLIARVGMKHGAFKSSVWNHVGGLVFVFFWLILRGPSEEFFTGIQKAPLYVFVGGIIGAFFVAISSILVPRLGLLKVVTLMISGQMAMGAAIDIFTGRIDSLFRAGLGVSLVILGAVVGAIGKSNRSKS